MDGVVEFVGIYAFEFGDVVVKVGRAGSEEMVEEFE